MADFVISVVTKVTECLWDLTIPQGQYLFCTKKIVKDLEKTKDELTSTRDNIEDCVQQAKRRTEIIEKPVERWLNEVNSQLEEAEKLQQEMEANNNCFQGCCPPWRRYHMSKQMIEKTSIMTELISKCDIKPFSHPAPLQNNYYNSNENFVLFESTKLVYNELLKALQDDDTYMIGLFGMGGSGKTSLVTEVGKWAKESNLVDLLLSITVSQNPDITNFQEKIAEKLNFELREKFDEGRAERLRLRLKEEKRVLIIVDDLWEKFNLNHIGIDFDTKGRGMCKVLLTSRRERVCTVMNCQKKFHLQPLTEEEAWTLFQKFAGIDHLFPSNLLNVAREVARECKGLPIALKAVGSSLKGSSREFQADEWKLALQKLQASIPIDGEGNENGAISSLKLSYEYLKNKEAELLFLMCAVFPEDHEIHIEDLIRYGVGLGIGGEFGSFESARSSVKVGLYKLIDFGLLLYLENKKYYVKMHDLARDTALWISSKEDRTIMVNLAKDLNSLADDRGIKQCFAISSWYNKTDQISRQLVAPKLEILIMNTRSSLDLSYVSFEFMKRLKVLAIINEFFPEISIPLPQSIQSLANLKTLRLRRLQLGDISFILSLEGLEVLDLKYCIFNEVPDIIENLHNLKLLDLRCASIENYNSKAIGRCSQLEALYVSPSLYPGCKFTCPLQCFVHDVNPTSLLRYKLELGGKMDWYLPYDDSIMRVVDLINFDVSTVDRSKRNLLQKAESVFFNYLSGGFKNIFPDIDQAVGCMNELNRLRLYSCSEIECLFDTTSNHAGSFQGDALLPCRLITLRLEEMKKLTEVCHGEPPLDLFKKLEELHIHRCEQLHSIFPQQCNLVNLEILNIYGLGSTNCSVVVLFSMSIAKNMQQLEVLTIEGCPELRHVITTEVEDGANTREEISLAPNNSHFLFPNLKKLRISKCPKLQVIFPISCVQQNEIQTMLPRLQVFELHDLENLLGIFPQNYNSRWPSVSELSWTNCPKLTTPWIGLELRKDHLNKEAVPNQDHQKPLTPKLPKLTLIELPELMMIWFGPNATQILSFQYLQCLEIVGFKEMKFIFSTVVLRSLSELTSLKIGNCEELVEIIEENEEFKNFTPDEVFFPKLSLLEIKRCNKLKSLFSIAMIRELPQLSILHVSEATQLKEIFGQSSEEDVVNGVETVVPNLTKIELEKLHSFVNIYEGFMLHKLKLQAIVIDGCPKFSPILVATQAIPLHRRTEEKFILWPIPLTMDQLSRQQMHPVALKAFLSIEFFALRNNGVEGILQLQLVEEELGGLHQCNTSKQKYLNSNLEILYLSELPELRFIWSGPAQLLGFEKLKDIEVEGCPKLKTIFPRGIVGSLENLRRLTICNCEELEGILQSQLVEEELGGLHKYLNSNLHGLCLSELPELRIIWSGPTQFLGFDKLEYIKVEGCPKLKTIFPPGSVGSLKNLRQLTICNCEELQEISDLQVECFPEILTVKVVKCNKLKCIFYADCMASRRHASLRWLCARHCSQLERIYGLKHPTEADNKDHGEREVLLDLLELVLESLPNFTEIGQGIKLKKRASHRYMVKDCPKYIQQFPVPNTDSHGDDVVGSSQL